MRWLVPIVAMLAFAPAAHAQGPTIQADDTTLKWSPEGLVVKVGEKVTWTWDGTPPHNVDSTLGNWDVTSGTTSPFEYTFTEEGQYDYVCQFHAGMNGRVVVTDATGDPPPPPPPPPPSQQPWANDQPLTTVFEVVDEVRPTLARLRAARVRNGARLRFRLSERAQVIVRFERNGRAVRTARRTFGKGAGRLTVRGRRLEGRYRIEAFARDLSGNRSRVRRTRVTIR
jgi:plastocyanin